MRHTILIAVLLLMAPLPAWTADSPKVQARVDRTAVSLREAVQLYITVTNGKDITVDTNPITDFTVSSHGPSSSTIFSKQGRLRRRTFPYILVPKRSGELSIPSLTVTASGQTFKTDPFTITVSEPAEPKSSQTDKKLWIEALISDPSPFIGQHIFYTLKLYSVVQVYDGSFSPPGFDGFDAKRIDKQKQYYQTLDGRQHMVTEITIVLTPRKTGATAIGQAYLRCSVAQQLQRRHFSPLDSLFSQGEPVILQSNTVQVDVRPLPPYHGDIPFSGLIGRFELDTTIENTDLKVGDSTTLTLTLKGRGNIQDAAPPTVTVPDGFKVYTDNPEEDITLGQQGYTGKKIFRTALVATAAGSYTLSPVQLAYLDTVDKTYKTISAQPITVRVEGDAQSRAITIAPANLPPIKKKVAFTGRDILPLKQDLNALRPVNPLSLSGFLIWLIAPLPVTAGLLLIQRRRRKNPTPAARMKARALAALKTAEMIHDDAKTLLTHLYQALGSAIFSAAGRSGEALTWKEAEALLLDNGREQQTARGAADLLARIESMKFSGAALDSADQKDLLQQTQAMVRKLAP